MIMRKTLAGISVGAIMGLSLAPALAQEMIDGSDVDAIKSVIEGFGSATVETDGEGDPKIVARMSGTRYSVYFYGCNDQHEKCDSLLFTTAWAEPGITLEQINAWNADMRFGRAYLDEEGDPVVEMGVNLEYGVTKRNFDDTVDYWSSVLKRFKEEVLKSG